MRGHAISFVSTQVCFQLCTGNIALVILHASTFKINYLLAGVTPLFWLYTALSRLVRP